MNEPWLIQEEWLGTIIGIAHREGDIKALEAYRAEKLPLTDKATYRNDAALIPLSGPIFPKANMFTEVSGATSLSEFAKDYQAAVDNPDISTIVIDTDSPGGVVTDVAEMASLIKNSSKHTISYVRGAAASAAYWIASAADEMVLSPTAVVGSIGVVTAYRKKDSDESEIEFVNSASPNKRLDPASDEGKEAIVSRLDDLAEVFIKDVALNRNVTESVVVEKFGKGGVLVGSKAVAAGMADRISTFEGLMTELVGKTTGEYDMDMATLKAEHRKTYDAILALGAEEATTASQAKISELEAENSALKEENKVKGEQLADNDNRLKALEKKDSIRAMQAMKATADGILESKLAGSSVPEALHGKVKGFLKYEDHVSEDNGFDKAAFEAAVDKEIGEWTTSLGESVQGMGDSGGEGESADDNSTDVDAAVERMLSHVNGGK